MSDFSVYKSLEASRVGASSEIANGAAPVAQSHTHEDRWRVANLSANLAEDAVGTSKYRAVVQSASIVPSKAAVANTTDYGVVTLSKRTGNGAAVTVGTANLANVALVAFVPAALTLVSNIANTTLAAGDVLTLTTVNTGNGVANNPACSFVFVLEDT